MIPAFTVINNATGEEVDKWSLKVIDEYGLEVSLKHSTFAITEDGHLCVIDMYGKIYDCPKDRFSVVFKKEVKQ